MSSLRIALCRRYATYAGSLDLDTQVPSTDSAMSNLSAKTVLLVHPTMALRFCDAERHRQRAAPVVATWNERPANNLTALG